MPASLVEGGHAQRCFYYVTSTHLTKADWTLGRTLPKPGQSDPLSHEYELTPSECECMAFPPASWKWSLIIGQLLAAAIGHS